MRSWEGGVRTRTVKAGRTWPKPVILKSKPIKQRRIGRHDPQIKIRRLPAVFAEEESEDRETPQPGHVFFFGQGQGARTCGAVLQAALIFKRHKGANHGKRKTESSGAPEHKESGRRGKTEKDDCASSEVHPDGAGEAGRQSCAREAGGVVNRVVAFNGADLAIRPEEIDAAAGL